MTDRPILFSAPMVRAILDGTKTQTRRVAKTEITMGRDSILAPRRGKKHASTYFLRENAADAVACCPYGQSGDRLWVRETHAPQADCWGSWERWSKGVGGPPPIIHYAADVTTEKPFIEKWRPSIHMPRWASRITLEITGVRVERLQDLTADDAMAEGIVRFPDGGYAADTDGRHYHAASAWYSYGSLWEAINGPGSWEANPWVWVVEFKRVKP